MFKKESTVAGGQALITYNNIKQFINFLHLLKSVCEYAQAVVRMCSMKKVFYENFAEFTGKYLCQSLFFNKIASLQPENQTCLDVVSTRLNGLSQ